MADSAVSASNRSDGSFEPSLALRRRRLELVHDRFARRERSSQIRLMKFRSLGRIPEFAETLAVPLIRGNARELTRASVHVLHAEFAIEPQHRVARVVEQRTKLSLGGRQRGRCSFERLGGRHRLGDVDDLDQHLGNGAVWSMQDDCCQITPAHFAIRANDSSARTHGVLCSRQDRRGERRNLVPSVSADQMPQPPTDELVGRRADESAHRRIHLNHYPVCREDCHADGRGFMGGPESILRHFELCEGRSLGGNVAPATDSPDDVPVLIERGPRCCCNPDEGAVLASHPELSSARPSLHGVDAQRSQDLPITRVNELNELRGTHLLGRPSRQCGDRRGNPLEASIQSPPEHHVGGILSEELKFLDRQLELFESSYLAGHVVHGPHGGHRSVRPLERTNGDVHPHPRSVVMAPMNAASTDL